jgi:prolyl-tRNA synthetase
VQTVLDTSLKASSSLFAVHAFASDTTLFLKGSEIAAYLSGLETTEAKVQEVDFTELKNEASAPSAAPVAAAAKPTPKNKEDGKIEGAIQIGILYQKEADFAGWYTDARSTHFKTVRSIDGHCFRRFYSRLICWITTASAVAIF